MFSFTKATVVSATAEACIFRVHGTGLFDVLIQVANRQELEQWCARFNSAGDSPLASFLTCSNGGTTEIDSSSSSNTTGTRTLTTAHEPYPHPKQNSDSRRNLLRQESNVTLESIDNCIHQQPVVSASINDHRLPPPPPNPFSRHSQSSWILTNHCNLTAQRLRVSHLLCDCNLPKSQSLSPSMHRLSRRSTAILLSHILICMMYIFSYFLSLFSLTFFSPHSSLLLSICL